MGMYCLEFLPDLFTSEMIAQSDNDDRANETLADYITRLPQTNFLTMIHKC